MKILRDLFPYVIIFVTVVLLRTYIITPVVVSGTSMDPTLKDGDVLLLKKYEKNFSRFDIVVFQYGNDRLVKRIVGVPGDYLKYEDGILYINNEKIEDKFASITTDYDLHHLNIETIPEGYYFVLGDNRPKSSDSRYIGLIKQSDILGSTTFSIWPFKSIK